MVTHSVLEYASQIWSGGLTQLQKKNIERVQKRVLRIIYPDQDIINFFSNTERFKNSPLVQAYL